MTLKGWGIRSLTYELNGDRAFYIDVKDAKRTSVETMTELV